MATKRNSLGILLPFFVAGLSSAAQSPAATATCHLDPTSIVGQTSAGVAQVSNVGRIEVVCWVPARPFPTTPGEFRLGLTASTTASQQLRQGVSESVPASASTTGGGTLRGQEWVNFGVHIPLTQQELDSESKRFLEKFLKQLSATHPSQAPVSPAEQLRMLALLRELNPQHRLGTFTVACAVMAGDQTLGTGAVTFEVIAKGRFSDLGPPLAPPM